MTPESTWRRPFCQVRVSATSRRTMAAAGVCGPCFLCGRRMTDGHHTYPGAPLLCDDCCPMCHPELAQISASIESSTKEKTK